VTNSHTRRTRYVTTSVVIARISFHACDAGLQKCDSETVYNDRTAVTYSPIAMCDQQQQQQQRQQRQRVTSSTRASSVQVAAAA